MNESEYLSREKFPLTNRQKLDLADQQMIDAINQDDLERMIDHGQPMSEKQQGILRELRIKAAMRRRAAAAGA